MELILAGLGVVVAGAAAAWWFLGRETLGEGSDVGEASQPAPPEEPAHDVTEAAGEDEPEAEEPSEEPEPTEEEPEPTEEEPEPTEEEPEPTEEAPSAPVVLLPSLASRAFAELAIEDQGEVAVLPVLAANLPGFARLAPSAALHFSRPDSRDCVEHARDEVAAGRRLVVLVHRHHDGPVTESALLTVGTLFVVTGWSHTGGLELHDVQGFALDPVAVEISALPDGAMMARYRRMNWDLGTVPDEELWRVAAGWNARAEALEQAPLPPEFFQQPSWVWLGTMGSLALNGAEAVEAALRRGPHSVLDQLQAFLGDHLPATAEAPPAVRAAEPSQPLLDAVQPDLLPRLHRQFSFARLIASRGWRADLLSGTFTIGPDEAEPTRLDAVALGRVTSSPEGRMWHPEHPAGGEPWRPELPEADETPLSLLGIEELWRLAAAEGGVVCEVEASDCAWWVRLALAPRLMEREPILAVLDRWVRFRPTDPNPRAAVAAYAEWLELPWVDSGAEGVLHALDGRIGISFSDAGLVTKIWELEA